MLLVFVVAADADVLVDVVVTCAVVTIVCLYADVDSVVVVVTVAVFYGGCSCCDDRIRSVAVVACDAIYDVVGGVVPVVIALVVNVCVIAVIATGYRYVAGIVAERCTLTTTVRTSTTSTLPNPDHIVLTNHTTTNSSDNINITITTLDINLHTTLTPICLSPTTAAGAPYTP